MQIKPPHAAISVIRFETRTLHTQRQQQYVRENGCARSVLRLLFAVVRDRDELGNAKVVYLISSDYPQRAL